MSNELVVNASVETITLKGDITDKLSAASIPVSRVNNMLQYQDITAEKADVVELIEQVADGILALITSVDSVEWLEADYDTGDTDENGNPVIIHANGEGYCQEYHAEIVRTLTDAACGTAVQGRAFKNTMSKVFDVPRSTFDATPKAQKGVKTARAMKPRG